MVSHPSLKFLYHGYPLTQNAYPFHGHPLHLSPRASYPPHEHHDQCLFCATHPSHHPTAPTSFLFIDFVDYVLTLYDYQMALLPTRSPVYAASYASCSSTCVVDLSPMRCVSM